MQALYSAFDFLIHPTFFDKDNPPLKLNIPAKTMGLVSAIVGAVLLLLLLVTLPIIIAIGTVATGLAALAGEVHPGILPVALLGWVIAIITDAMWTYGGWKLYHEEAEGRDMIIVALALSVIGNLVLDIGMATPGNVIGSLLINAVIYYFVVISRLPQEGPLPSASVAATGGTTGGYTPPQGTYTPPSQPYTPAQPTYTEPTQAPGEPYQQPGNPPGTGQ